MLFQKEKQTQHDNTEAQEISQEDEDVAEFI